MPGKGHYLGPAIHFHGNSFHFLTGQWFDFEKSSPTGEWVLGEATEQLRGSGGQEEGDMEGSGRSSGCGLLPSRPLNWFY